MRYESLTADRLREMLDYDPLTGIFRWRQRPYRNSRKKAGDEAGVLKHNGRSSYRYIGLDDHQYLASQLAWFFVHGRWAKGQVGVKNGNAADLRAENLIEMKTAPGKHDHETREGRSAYRKAYWDANAEYRRGLGFKRFYGIDLATYQQMLAAQNGVCAICQKPERAVANGKVKWLSVDHNHTDGAVRGLLCSHCNHLLGHASDDPDILRRAASYLDRHAAPSLPTVRTHPAFPAFREHVVPILLKDAA